MTPTRRLLVAALAFTAALPGAAAAADGDMSLGNAKAKVTVIEYASVTCSHCAHWQATEFDAFKAKYVDTGKVRYVLRELPTPPLPLATAGFLVARCAGADRYFAVVDTLLRTQSVAGQQGGALRWIMEASGMTEPQVRACVTDQAAADAFSARAEANVTEYDVKGTPTFVVNGKKLDGIPTLADLDAAIQPLLGKGEKAPSKKTK